MFKAGQRNRSEVRKVMGMFEDGLKEQEVALQRAYIAAKPTPQFWKKVAKLVPGKTAQDCFDKVHSDNLTPPQPRPRSRAKGTNLSSMGYFSLSASKLLKPTEPKIKRPSCNKQKSHLAQKTVRHLLQKHSNVDKLYEADLFSVLEPTVNPSTQAFQQSVILSTPEHAPEKQGLLQKFRERSSSGHKKSLSRLISSCGTALVSPPVLKPVKNRALHEKYIDQLHCREAKRKAASAKASKSVPEHEDREEAMFRNLMC
ncbi:hypothetical protein L1049_023497 [Liquidambar formosana]|uniref:Uncharacterized protein n=1 Tax=Liquidambar formosana TaxID=63359 RepID=A0AAP0RY97_LIQFO